MECVDIRPMIESDIPSIMEIENGSFKAPWSEKNFHDEFNNPFANLLVAVANDKVVGFIDYWVTFNSATICQIAIKENLRGQKIGSLLITEMINDCYAKRVQNVTLEVRKSNEIARKFYEKHQFLFNHQIDNYYSNGESALYMIRSIDING